MCSSRYNRSIVLLKKPETRAYLVTADVTESVRVAARQVGLAGVLYKPVKLKDVESVLR